MSISYSAITNYGRATLPSVEAGLGSMNILRDPPKSIMTRRIDKVGETSSITELIDQSGNRACEAISLYARGINPMVSVSYGNVGNNGGQRSGSCFGGSGAGDLPASGNAIGGGQAYLPYRIARDGAFRPPIIRQEQLMPLSRQPRTNTQAFTQPGFADFTKKLVCPGGNYRSVKQETLKSCVRPTATYRIDNPLVEPFEVKYVIKNPVKFDPRAGVSGIRTRDLTTQEVVNPTKGVSESPLHVENIYANQSGETVRYVDNSHMNTDKYIQDVLHSSVQSKMSQSIQITPIDEIMNVDIHTKDPLNISYTAPKSGNTKDDYIHKDIELQRRVLATTMATNKQRNIYSRPSIQHQAIQKRNRPIAHATTNFGTIDRQSSADLNSREYKLHPTINAGSFTGRGQMPMRDRMQNVNTHFESDKMRMSKKVMAMQLGRYG